MNIGKSLLKNTVKYKSVRMPIPWNVNDDRLVLRRTGSKPNSPLDFEFFRLQPFKPEPMMEETTKVVEEMTTVKPTTTSKKTSEEMEESGDGSMNYARSMRKNNKAVDAYSGFMEFIMHPMTWDRNNGYLNLILAMAIFSYVFIVTCPEPNYNTEHQQQQENSNWFSQWFTKK